MASFISAHRSIARALYLGSAWVFFLSACSDEGTTGQRVDTDPAQQVPQATGCTRPSIPDAPFAAARQVVGSGSPASCHEAALIQAVSVGGTITFSCGSDPHTITLSTELVPQKDVFLDGGGLITISGNGKTRILNMDKGGAANLRLRGLSLSRGFASGSGAAVLSSYRSNVYVESVTFDGNIAGASGEDGGALYLKSGSHGVIIGSRFTHNQGGTGGALHSLLSDLRVIDSIFSNNDATSGSSSGTQNGQAGGGYGAAIYIDGAAESGGSGEVVICGTRFLSNTSAGQGGAVFSFVYGQKVTIDRSLFQGNSVVRNARNDALGGALRHGNGPLNVLRSTFLGNSSADQGGALWIGESAPVTAENVTLYDNRAGSLGGALMLSSGTVTLRNATIVKNQAGSEGGAVLGDKRITLLASLVADNTAQNPYGNKQNCSQPGNLGNNPSPVLQGSGNLEWPTISNSYNNPYCTSGSVIADPLVSGVPGDNGGPVPTLALTAGSPAVAAGTNCAAIDARGQPRPTQCTLGAFELIP